MGTLLAVVVDVVAVLIAYSCLFLAVVGTLALFAALQRWLWWRDHDQRVEQARQRVAKQFGGVGHD